MTSRTGKSAKLEARREVSNLATLCAITLFLGMVMIWVRVLT